MQPQGGGSAASVIPKRRPEVTAETSGSQSQIVVMDCRFASASLRCPGMTPITKLDRLYHSNGPRLQLQSTIRCPLCRHAKREEMLENACSFFCICEGCGTRLLSDCD